MTEHERRIHDKTIKAYEQYQDEPADASKVPKMGQNYTAIQSKYIGKAFGSQGSPTSSSPMMNNAKRPNLQEVVSVSPYNQVAAPTQSHTASVASLHALNDNSKRQPSQLALAGGLNLLGMQSTKAMGASTIADEERLKKVMVNMEKEKSL